MIVTAVADEEHASEGVQAVLRRYGADACVVTEPTHLRAVVAHKGFVWAELETRGRAAHGSRPDLGVDAIAGMGAVLSGIGALQAALGARPHPLLGPASLHASLIDGGQELSSYPERCVLAVERRTLPGERLADVERELEGLLARAREADPRLATELRVGLVREPFEVDPQAAIVQLLLRGGAVRARRRAGDRRRPSLDGRRLHRRRRDPDGRLRTRRRGRACRRGVRRHRQRAAVCGRAHRDGAAAVRVS